MRAALLALFLVSCAAPQRLGLTRVQVCISAETGQTYYIDVPRRGTRGASVCADFEGTE